MSDGKSQWQDRAVDRAIRFLLGLALALPYRWRIPAMGWIVSRIVAPLFGWRRRIRDNLALTMPDLPRAEVERLVRDVPDNAGRTLIEIYSGREFVNRVKDTPLAGPGMADLEAARSAGRPVILVTAHFGNYDAPRAALFAQGYPLAALYRPMANTGFNDHYVRAISQIGEPVFPADRKGILGLLNHLRAGNIIGILIDIHAGKGPRLKYFGQEAYTAVSAAEWALKFDALLLPIYGRRLENGLDFEIIVDEPVAPSDPERMTQALNDSLERMVRKDMAQWFWIHRRWKKKRPKD